MSMYGKIYLGHENFASIHLIILNLLFSKIKCTRHGKLRNNKHSIMHRTYMPKHITWRLTGRVFILPWDTGFWLKLPIPLSWDNIHSYKKEMYCTFSIKVVALHNSKIIAVNGLSWDSYKDKVNSGWKKGIFWITNFISV